MANFDDPAISLSKTLDEMVKIEYNTNDNIAKVSQYNLNIIKWGTLTPYCHERNSDQMTIVKTNPLHFTKNGKRNQEYKHTFQGH